MVRLGVLCCAALLLLPRSAAAEWHFTPMGGITFLADTSIVDAERGTDESHLNAGFAVGWLSRSIFGAEVITTWTPSFFEGQHAFGDEPSIDKVKSSRAVSLMGNVLITLPQQWTEYGLRPFVSAGFGLMHANASGPAIVFPVDVNVSGFNVGGGAVGFLTKSTGLRFDVRYHTTLNRGSDAPSIGPVHLRYLTTSVGLVFRPGRR